MLGHRLTVKRGSRDEAEKPFWISFADLMTALMVLFLVALTAELNKVDAEREKAVAAEKDAHAKRQEATAALDQAKNEKEAADKAKAELEEERKNRNNGEIARRTEIDAFINELGKAIDKDSGVSLDTKSYVLNLGSLAEFGVGQHVLTYKQALAIGDLAPKILEKMRRTKPNWLKRIVIEGFTDASGDYLGNLDLSLQRSERVMCVLLAGEYGAPAQPKSAVVPDGFFSEAPPPQEPAPEIPRLSTEDEVLVKKYFLVGGYSSNSQKASADESRRIELRMEFYAFGEPQLPPAERSTAKIGKCRLGGR